MRHTKNEGVHLILCINKHVDEWKLKGISILLGSPIKLHNFTAHLNRTVKIKLLIIALQLLISRSNCFFVAAVPEMQTGQIRRRESRPAFHPEFVTG